MASNNRVALLAAVCAAAMIGSGASAQEAPPKLLFHVSADKTLDALRTTTEPGSPLIYRMNRTLDNVSDASRSIQELADYLRRNPGALLRGR